MRLVTSAALRSHEASQDPVNTRQKILLNAFRVGKKPNAIVTLHRFWQLSPGVLSSNSHTTKIIVPQGNYMHKDAHDTEREILGSLETALQCLASTLGELPERHINRISVMVGRRHESNPSYRRHRKNNQLTPIRIPDRHRLLGRWIKSKRPVAECSTKCRRSAAWTLLFLPCRWVMWSYIGSTAHGESAKPSFNYKPKREGKERRQIM